MAADPPSAGTLARLFFEAQDRMRGGPDPALCAAEYTAELGSGPPMDLAGHQGFAAGFYAGFPDARHHIEQIIEAGDRAAVRFVITGTHTGGFFGLPATGKSIRVPAHALLHVVDGRVEKLFGIFDEAGLQRRLTT